MIFRALKTNEGEIILRKNGEERIEKKPAKRLKYPSHTATSATRNAACNPQFIPEQIVPCPPLFIHQQIPQCPQLQINPCSQQAVPQCTGQQMPQQFSQWGDWAGMYPWMCGWSGMGLTTGMGSGTGMDPGMSMMPGTGMDPEWA